MLPVLAELRQQGGAVTDATRFALAVKAFEHTARYDGAIANYLGGITPGGEHAPFPRTLNFQFRRAQTMRYGENPHQHAAFYVEQAPAEASVATARQLQGKELSYNNVADTDAALECVEVILRGTGLRHRQARQSLRRGARRHPAEAYDRAFKTDPTSAFGGIIAFNRPLDAATARRYRRPAVRRGHHRAR